VLDDEDEDLVSSSSSSEPVAAVGASKASWVKKASASQIADLWKSLRKEQSKAKKPIPDELVITEPV